MAIRDLKPRQGNVELIADVVEKGDVREFEKFGKTGKVCTAKIKDNTGEMNLTLWNDQVDIVNEGDRVHIKNGYVNEYQGEKQLTTGKFGKLEVVNKDESSLETQTTDEGEQILTEDEKDEEEDLEELHEKPAGEEEMTEDEYEETVEEEILDKDE